MKNKIATFILVSFFSVTQGFAQVASLPPTQNTGPMIGVVAGIQGDVTLDRGSQVGQVIESGSKIYLGDKISTDSQGGLQILLLDETTFTIGPNSAIVVDQFIYDPTTDAGKVAVSVVEGTFRFITGKIGNKNPENMKIDLPNGTIAIRGTMVMGQVEGNDSLVILAGPGDKNNTGNKQGEIIVGGPQGDQGRQVRIAKTGFGTEIKGDNPPKLPFQVSPQVLNDMNQELQPQESQKKQPQNPKQPTQNQKKQPGPHHQNQQNPSQNNNQRQGPRQQGQQPPQGNAGHHPGNHQSATHQAGQHQVNSFHQAHGANVLTGLADQFGNESEKTSQEIANEFRETFDGVTRVGELTKVNSATGVYTASAFPLFKRSDNSPAGSFDATVFVDFNNRTMGGSGTGSQVVAKSVPGFYGGGGNFTFNLNEEKSFSMDPSQVARVIYNGVTDAGSCGACTANIDINLINAGGEVASGAVVNLEMFDSGGADRDIKGTGVAPRTS